MNTQVISSKARLFLFVWAQLGWFGCVYADKFGLQLLSLLIPALAWAVLLRTKSLPRRTLLLVFCLAAFGFLFDAALANFELIHFNPQPNFASIFGVPVWLVSMWLLFVTILPLMAELFKKSAALNFVLGAIGGPLTYKSGEAFEVMYLSGPIVLIIYAAFWGIYFTSALYLIRKSYEN